MKAIHEELSTPDWSEVADEIADPESCASWLIAVKAFEAVVEKTGEQPGEQEAKAKTEFEMMRHEA